MKYEFAPDLQVRMDEIVRTLAMNHIDLMRVKCYRSRGSSTKRTIARCHTVGKLMQKAMNMPAHYAIEFLERFDKMSLADQDKVIIHELMHIPQTFGGGFRQHDFVCEENVEKFYEKFVNLKEGKPALSQFEERQKRVFFWK
jgi:predicted metallopeptidase